MNGIPRRLVPVGVFLAIVVAGGLTAALINWNYEFLFYGGVLVVQIWLVWWMDRRVRFSQVVLWGLAVWAAVHLAGGTVPIPVSVTEPGRPANLYDLRLHPLTPKFDQVVHFAGFAVATLAAWECLVAATGGKVRASAGPLALVALAGIGLGAMNEVIEFVATRVMPETNVGGYENTGWDLVCNAIGAVAAVACLAARGRAGVRLEGEAERRCSEGAGGTLVPRVGVSSSATR